MVKPKSYQSALLFISDSWDSVMDARFNPLRYIRDPSLQAYFMLVLFLMWSVYFGFLASNYFAWTNYDVVTSIFLHIAVLLPIMATNAVFKDAERDGAAWLQAWRKQQRDYRFSNTLGLRKKENICRWDLESEG